MQKLHLLLTALLSAACWTRPARLPPDHIGIALVSWPVSFDPHRTNESVSFIVNSNVYDTLVSTDASSVIVPSLAARWFNPDDLTWVFDLRQAVRFHDGSLFGSGDVAWSLSRVQNEPESGWPVMKGGIREIETPTPQRVVFRTTRPFPLLLRYLAEIAIVPRGAGRSLDSLPIGTGPYRLVSADQQRPEIRLVRFEGYSGQRPALNHVSFHVIPDDGERTRAILSGRVDLLADVPPDALEDLRRTSSLRVLEAPGVREMFLAFDMKRPRTPYVSPAGNPFRDRRVREALLLAIDTRSLLRPVRALAVEATQFAAPSVLGYDPKWHRPAVNLPRARALLREAGYPDGFAVTLDAPRGVYLADGPVAAAVAESLGGVGIHVRVNALGKEDLFRKLNERDTSFYMLSWNCLTADMQEIFDYLLHTPDPSRGLGSDNAGQYSNPDVDALADRAAQTMTHTDRVDLLRSATRLALADIPWIPLYVQKQVYVLREPFRWQPRQDKKIGAAEITIAP